MFKKILGFQKKNKNVFTAHPVICLIENIEKAIDNKLFVDLQKVFDIVDCNILLHKRSFYGIRDLANC